MSSVEQLNSFSSRGKTGALSLEFEKISPVIGRERAETMMQTLPPTPDTHATQH